MYQLDETMRRRGKRVVAIRLPDRKYRIILSRTQYRILSVMLAVARRRNR